MEVQDNQLALPFASVSGKPVEGGEIGRGITDADVAEIYHPGQLRSRRVDQYVAGPDIRMANDVPKRCGRDSRQRPMKVTFCSFPVIGLEARRRGRPQLLPEIPATERRSLEMSMLKRKGVETREEFAQSRRV